ncbi:hypothetical protein [Lactobacillus corticis]|uniref:Uncharacterized protein n=1 Tax=Lactobacillus corticis TaxID=2201249 RepID=A0A916QHF6_9LACO|nr:hypothetical protein [Lactobacillus corticis]GFZ27440.1 hypothetical protein LCB40_13200 [Lactobacillus corticis]
MEVISDDRVKKSPIENAVKSVADNYWTYLIDQKQELPRNNLARSITHLLHVYVRQVDSILRKDRPMLSGKDLTHACQKYVEEYPDLTKIWTELKPANQYKVCLLTTDKFLLPSIKFTNVGGHFWQTEDRDQPILIIDEFDGQKQVWLNRMITDACTSDFDKCGLLQLMKDLKSALSPARLDALPNEFKHDHSRDELEKYNKCLNKNFRGLVESETGNRLRYDPSLQFKLDDQLTQILQPTFLFRSIDHPLVSHKQELYFYYDENSNVYKLNAEAKGTELGRFLFKIVELTQKFTKTAYKVALNALKAQHSDIEDTELLMKKVESFFNVIFNQHFAETEQMLTYFLSKYERTNVSLPRINQRLQHRNKLLDTDPYLQLIDFIKIDRKSGDEYAVSFTAHQLNQTPEALLTELGRRQLVIGLSATSRNDSSIANFSSRHIETEVEWDDLKLIDADIEDLQQSADEIKKQLEDSKAEIKTILLSVSELSDRVEIFTSLLKQYKISLPSRQISKIIAKLNLENDDRKDFLFKREMQTLAAILDFLTQPDPQHKAMIIFKNAKANIAWYELLLEQAFPKLSPQIREFYSGEDFELSDTAEPQLIFTTYASAGRSLNITLPLKRDQIANYVVVDSRRLTDSEILQRDLDAAYFEKPRNIGKWYVNQDGRVRPDDALQIILENAGLAYDGEISEETAIENDLTYLEQRPISKNSKNDLYSVRVAGSVFLEQAAGRLQRTVIKPNITRYYWDESILDHRTGIDFSYLEDKQTIPAIEALLGKYNWTPQVKAASNVDDINNGIEYIYQNELPFLQKNAKSRKFWKDLRAFILLNLYGDEPGELTKWGQFYYDFGKPVIDWEYKNGPANADYTPLAAIGTNLSGESLKNPFLNYQADIKAILNNNPEIAKEFKDAKFDFSKPHRYWLVPPMIFNFYLAAFSEKVIQIVLKGLGLDVHEMPDRDFERFDGLVIRKNKTGCENIYWDAKYWRPSNHLSSTGAKQDRAKTLAKLQSGEKVMIINLIADDKKYELPSHPKADQDGKLIVEIPALFEKNGRINVDAIKVIKEVCSNGEE